MRLLAFPLLIAFALAGCTGEGCPPGTARQNGVCVKVTAPEPTAPADDEDDVAPPEEEEPVAESSLPACVPYALLGQACSCPCTTAGCVSEFEFTDGPCCRCMGSRGVVCAAPITAAPLQCPSSN